MIKIALRRDQIGTRRLIIEKCFIARTYKYNPKKKLTESMYGNRNLKEE